MLNLEATGGPYAAIVNNPANANTKITLLKNFLPVPPCDELRYEPCPLATSCTCGKCDEPLKKECTPSKEEGGGGGGELKNLFILEFITSEPHKVASEEKEPETKSQDSKENSKDSDEDLEDSETVTLTVAGCSNDEGAGKLNLNTDKVVQDLQEQLSKKVQEDKSLITSNSFRDSDAYVTILGLLTLLIFIAVVLALVVMVITRKR